MGYTNRRILYFIPPTLLEISASSLTNIWPTQTKLHLCSKPVSITFVVTSFFLFELQLRRVGDSLDFQCDHYKHLFVSYQYCANITGWIFFSNSFQWLSFPWQCAPLSAEAWPFLSTNISQGSVVTHLRGGGIFYYRCTTNLLLSLSVKEFWKSVSILQSSRQKIVTEIFWTRCIKVRLS